MSLFDSLGSLRFFDAQVKVDVTERRLPHWAQAGTLCFLTWRTWDSMPKIVLDSWHKEREVWLGQQGIDSCAKDWQEELRRLPPAQQQAYRRKLSERWEACLDECHGSCVLRRPDLAQIVADSLKFFDGQRYMLTDFVVMPNHVHLLAGFADAEQMLKQCDSWKHYTAVKINKLLGRRGHFWQVDGFDHLVRSPEEFEYLRRYIAENPGRAKLRPGEFIHYSRSGVT